MPSTRFALRTEGGATAGPAIAVGPAASSDMSHVLRILDRLLTRLLEFAVALLLATAAGLGMYQVLMRFALQQPSTWSEALTRTLIIWMVYLGAALAVRAGLLVAVDVLRKLAPARLRCALDFAALGFTFVFFAVVAWFGTAITSRVRFQNLAGLEVSISWAYAALPIGAGLAALVALIAMARQITERDANAPRSDTSGG
jgi:TRAP-type C4-dicarboxylate transport system permease small subunit